MHIEVPNPPNETTSASGIVMDNKSIKKGEFYGAIH